MMDATRYASQIALPQVGVHGQQKLQAAKILVVGAGGLGCPVLNYLTGMGIGSIGIVDDDAVALQNLHRQVLYSEADVGRPKVEAAHQKLQQQNSSINIIPIHTRLTAQNAEAIISGYHVVIDCTDNAAVRYVIDDACKKAQIPFVYAAVQQMEAQLSVFNYKNGPGYRNLFADEDAAAYQNPCAADGIMGYVTGMMGCLQVSEAVKIILENKNVLSGSVLVMNMETLLWRKFKIGMG